MQKIVVSNIRFPQDIWLQLKSGAASHDMSVNEYLLYLNQIETVRSITGQSITKTKPSRAKAYEALRSMAGIASRFKGKSMGASDDDKIIYGIE